VINAGSIPSDHWLRNMEVGGGRIIGEGCHWLDFMSFLVGQSIHSVARTDVASETNYTDDDSATVTLKFADGSNGTLHYLAKGNRSFPKERITVFSDGRVLELDNFRTLHSWGWSGFRRMKLWKQDKGHNSEITSFVDAVSGGYSVSDEFA